MQLAIGTNLLATQLTEVSVGRIWTGWGISGLVAAFMLLNALGGETLGILIPPHLARCARGASIHTPG
jgi:hypothetical protein